MALRGVALWSVADWDTFANRPAMKRTNSSRSISGPAACLAWANKIMQPYGVSANDFVRSLAGVFCFCAASRAHACLVCQTVSWADGRGMCALVSAAFPDKVDFKRHVLPGGTEADRRANFELAFETARLAGGCPRLLDVDDMFPVPEKLSTTLYVSELRKRCFDGVSLSQCASRSESDTEEAPEAGGRATSAVLTAAAEQLKHEREIEEKTKARVREQKRQEAEEKQKRERVEKERTAKAAREAEEKALKEKEEREKAARAARVQEALEKEMEQSRGGSGASSAAAAAAPTAVSFAAPKPTVAASSGSSTPTLGRRGSTLEGRNPKTQIAAVAANDAKLDVLDFSGNTMFSMKHREYAKELGAVLAGNTHLKELHLKSCDLDKVDVQALMEGLSRNQTLTVLDLEKNKIDNEGAAALAVALRENSGIRELNLLNQAGRAFGDACLTAFVDMFEYNVTLTKIIWRLDSRKSFAINKLLVRNNTIRKNLDEGRDVSKIIPSNCNVPDMLTRRVALSPRSLAATDDANEEEPQDEPNSNAEPAQDKPLSAKELERMEAEERWKREAEEEAAAEKAVAEKKVADEKARAIAEKKALQEAERRDKEEAEKKAKAEKKALLEKEEAEKKARIAAEAEKKAEEKKAREEAERKAKEEADRKLKEEKAKAAAEAERRAALEKAEADKKAKEAERKEKEEADKKAKEAERKEKEEADKAAKAARALQEKEEAENKARVEAAVKEAERDAKEAEAKAKHQAAEKAKAEKKAKEEEEAAAKKSREEAAKKAEDERARKAKEAEAEAARLAKQATPSDAVLCWDCKTPNAPAYKFCDHCGAAPKKVAVDKVAVAKPAEAVAKPKVEEVTKPAVVAKPAEVAKPVEAAVKPKAEETAKPAVVAKLAADAKPVEVAKPAEAAVKPTAAVPLSAKTVDKKASLRNANTLRAVEESAIGRIFFGEEASSARQDEFVKYLDTKHCAELGAFLRELSVFKLVEDRDMRAADARHIYETFIKQEEAVNEWESKTMPKLNLSAALLAEFQREYEADPSNRNVFDLVECECLTLVRSNKFEAGFLELLARESRGEFVVLPESLMRRVMLMVPLRDLCRARRVSSYFRTVIDHPAVWEALSIRSNVKPYCRDLKSFISTRAKSIRFAPGTEVVLNLASLRGGGGTVIQSTMPLLPSHLAPATCYWEFEASGLGLAALKGTVGVATLGGQDVRGLPFAGEHFFNDKTVHPSDCSPLCSGGTRGVGLEWPTKQIFLCEGGRMLFFESIADMFPTPAVELYATIVIEAPAAGAIGTVKFDFNFGSSRAFSYDLESHLTDRVPEVAQSLRLKEKYALPIIRCSLCGIQVPITEDGIVESHNCSAPATPKKNDEAGCVLQ